MIRALSLFAVAFLLAAPAGAAGRFVLQEVEGGFIRLDTETGAVSHCRSSENQWRCELVADAQSALQDEINRLAAENAALEQQLAALNEPQAAPTPAPRFAPQREPGAAPPLEPRLELPSEEDVERLFGFFEGIMRRFIDFARSLNEDPGRET